MSKKKSHQARIRTGEDGGVMDGKFIFTISFVIKLQFQVFLDLSVQCYSNTQGRPGSLA